MRFTDRPPVLLISAGLLAAALLAGCAGPSGTGRTGSGTFEPVEVPADSGPAAADRTEWVDETLASLTLEEKAAQLVFIRAFGYYLNDETDHIRRLFHLVRDNKVGGVCIFQSDVHSGALLLNRLQEASALPLLVASDFEWGAAMRFRRSTRFPEAMALGATRDTLLAWRMGKRIAAEARALGIHQVYAPVADVNLNPDNPVINTRSFGEDPRLVAELAIAVARGLQDGGVIATAKHYPGHGDTNIDSHIGLPVLRFDRARLDSVELYPFRQLVHGGVASVMVAHAAIPAIGTDGGRLPATLLPAAIDSILIGEMGFDGLIVTDAMDMGALVKGFGVDSATVLAIEAGVDVILLPLDEAVAIDAIAAAVRSGRITEARLNASVRKVLSLKYELGLPEQRTVDLAGISNVVSGRESAELAADIARASVTLLQNDTILPLGNRKGRIAHVIVGDQDDYRTEIGRPGNSAASEQVGDYYARMVSSRWPATTTLRLPPSANKQAIDSIAAVAARAGTVLLSIFSKARSGLGKMGLEDSHIAAIRKVLDVKPAATVVVSFGSPYVLRSFAGAAAYVCLYSDAEASVEAAAQFLFGEIPSRGTLPVSIPGFYGAGAGILQEQMVLRHGTPESAGFDAIALEQADSVIIKAIADSVFPAAQLVVARGGIIVRERAYGTMTYDHMSAGTTLENLFDIASMTKVFATTAAMMRLVEEGKVRLGEPVRSYLPRFADTPGSRIPEKAAVTVEQLLRHTSGLPPFRQLYLTCKDSAQAADSIYATELVFRPGDSTLYSDIGFILLGWIVESASGVSLDRYVDSVFYRPLGMERTMFKPTAVMAPFCVPTEYDSVYRQLLVQGVVHDENAHLLGGVSGHAGLFSTASDLAIFMQMLSGGGGYSGVRYLQPETIARFLAPSRGERPLGWDSKTVNGYSSAGNGFGKRSYGHTGFTGTSVWADPDRNIFVIFLTNRVHPTRNNSEIRAVRPALHDAVINALRGRQARTEPAGNNTGQGAR